MDAEFIVRLRSAGVELLDGCDPGSFLLDPAAFGIGGYPLFDLLGSGFHGDAFFSLPGSVREHSIELAPPRMPALNKSSGRTEYHRAYYAFVSASDGSALLVAHYTWFEASPARFHLWLYTLLEIPV